MTPGATVTDAPPSGVVSTVTGPTVTPPSGSGRAGRPGTAGTACGASEPGAAGGSTGAGGGVDVDVVLVLGAVVDVDASADPTLRPRIPDVEDALPRLV